MLLGCMFARGAFCSTSTFSAQTMIPADAFKKFLPKEYHAQHFAQNIRADGRSLLVSRQVETNVNPITSTTSSMVTIGRTNVICGIKCEMAQPAALTPRDGFIVVNIDCSPLCSSAFKPGPPSQYVQASSDFLQTVFKGIDLEQLCIEEGQKVWCLHVDVICLNHDGSLLDAAVHSIRTALNNLVLPKIAENECEFVLGISPKCTTIGIFDDLLILDPTADEEAICQGHVVLIADDDGNVLRIEKNGKGVSFEQLKECIKLAKERSFGGDTDMAR
jgi:exosome complex component RRP43